jgi:hypothetical protein
LRDATDTHTLISPVQSSADVIVGEITVQTLTNKTMDKQLNTMLSVNDTVHADRLKSQKIVVANIANGQFVDGAAMVTGEKLLITGQDDSNPAFPSTENGLYLINAVAPPTRLDTGYQSSQKYYIKSGNEWNGTLWTCHEETGSDVSGINSLFFSRIDNKPNLWGRMYQNGGTVSLTTNVVANTYDKLLLFNAGSSVGSQEVAVNTATDIITLAPDRLTTFIIKYWCSWDSTTSGGKTYDFSIFTNLNGGGAVQCISSLSRRGLPNNDEGEISGSCIINVNSGDSLEVDLRASCTQVSANITSYSAHVTVTQIS